MIGLKVVRVLEKTLIGKLFQFFHAAFSDTVGDHFFIEIHKTGKLEQRSAGEFFLTFLFCNSGNGFDKTGNCFGRLRATRAHIVQKAIVVRTSVSQATNGVEDVAIDRDALGIFPIIELNELNQAVKTDDFHQNPHGAITRLDACTDTSYTGRGTVVYIAEVKILVDQFAGENGVGFLFDAVTDLRKFS